MHFPLQITNGPWISVRESTFALVPKIEGAFAPYAEGGCVFRVDNNIYHMKVIPDIQVRILEDYEWLVAKEDERNHLFCALDSIIQRIHWPDVYTNEEIAGSWRMISSLLGWLQVGIVQVLISMNIIS